jgi:small redox-active disulfide protein 2
MKITIYGTGCKKCKQLFANAEAAVAAAGVEAEAIKVESLDEIVHAGIMFTPGLAIDGQVKSMGKVPTADQIAQWLTDATS